jgi:hypothetical protein
MKLKRDNSEVSIEFVTAYIREPAVFIADDTAEVTLTIEELRWLCLVAGPAVLDAADG